MRFAAADRGGTARVSADIPSLLLYGGAGLSAFFGAYQLLETYFIVPHYGTRTLYLLHMWRGITAALLLSALAAWYLVQNPTIAPRVASSNAMAGASAWQGGHLRWFVKMRWLAAAFALALIVIAVPLTGILSAAHLPQLLVCWMMLVVANFLFVHALQRGFSFDSQVIAQSVVDLAVLTGMLNAAGGIENPLSIAYLFHVIIAGILLPKRKAIGVAVFGSVIFSFLALGEMFELLPHATILLFPHSYSTVGGHLQIHHAAHDPVFVAGRVLSFVAVMLLTAHFTTMITERLRESESDVAASARKAILEQRRLEGVIDAAGLGMAIISGFGTIEWMNSRLAVWLDWPDSAAGSPCPHDHAEGHGCIACAASQTLLRGRQEEIEMARPSRNGHLRFFRSAISPVTDADGNIAQAVAIVEEVTARRALEAEALHAGRLAVLGQLAAGIAHEIGNPLSSLHARLQLMRRRPDPAFHHDSLEVLQNQIDRIGRIVRNVAHLAQKARDGWVTVDLNAVVSEAVTLVKLDARAAEIRFGEQLQDALPPVRGIRDQLLQVVLNLLLNAIEAMPSGGMLQVATSCADHHVNISVADSGTGIDPTVRDRLFEPFFTTKTEGTGLGLSICTSLVHAHGGTIAVDSEPGRGSRFTVQIPVAAAVSSSLRVRT